MQDQVSRIKAKPHKQTALTTVVRVFLHLGSMPCLLCDGLVYGRESRASYRTPAIAKEEEEPGEASQFLLDVCECEFSCLPPLHK